MDQKWKVVDSANVQAGDQLPVVHEADSEDAAAEWIGSFGDPEKRMAGLYTIDGPSNRSTERRTGKVPLEPFEQRMEADALELAGRFDLAELALMVEGHAPAKRSKWSTEARIPWRLVYAIRLRRKMEDI